MFYIKLPMKSKACQQLHMCYMLMYLGKSQPSCGELKAKELREKGVKEEPHSPPPSSPGVGGLWNEDGDQGGSYPLCMKSVKEERMDSDDDREEEEKPEKEKEEEEEEEEEEETGEERSQEYQERTETESEDSDDDHSVVVPRRKKLRGERGQNLPKTDDAPRYVVKMSTVSEVSYSRPSHNCHSTDATLCNMAPNLCHS